MSEKNKSVTRRAMARLATGSALATAALANAAEPEDVEKDETPVRLIQLEIGDNLVIRRSPATGAAMWSSLVAFDADGRNLDRLRQPLTIPEGAIEADEPPALDLPELITGLPEFSDIDPLEEGEVLVLEITFIRNSNRISETGGILVLPKDGAAVAPPPVKLGRLIIKFEAQKDIIPSCLQKKLVGVKVSFDFDWYITTSRICSTYLTRDGSNLYLHGAITLIREIKWCWKFPRLVVSLVEKFTWVVAQALSAVGLSETAAKVKSVVNSILGAIRKASPGLIP